MLILDGMNNHDWRVTTEALHATLDATGLFEVSVATAPEIKFHRTMPREPKDADEATKAAYQEAKTVYDKANTMGHFWPRQTDWDSLYCVGFQTVFARSVEFVATGGVTLDLPAEFLGPDAVSIVPPHQLSWTVNGAPTLPEVVEQTAWRKKKDANELCLLSLEEAAEAMVQEPVLAVWDGNGAMYVAEMRSYMQNASGDGTKTLKNGRVKRLVDEDGDGIMDRATVFVDGLNLPRMILPLDDRIAVVETDHTAGWSYRDTDGDGVADEKKLLFEGRPGSPKTSVEHQNSGLIWNLDNWIYTSYGHERFRFTTGAWEKESMVHHWAQWGLDREFQIVNDRWRY